MSVKSDIWIEKMAREHRMIDPFETGQVREGVISYGLSSYGYDIRVADDFKIFTNVNTTVVDPKNFDANSFVEFRGEICTIPPNSFALARSIEYMRMPRNVTGIVLGKCVAGDTRIVNYEDGSYIPIKEIAGPINTLAFVEGEIKRVPSSQAIYNGKKPLYRLKLKSGREIKATANHPFLTVLGWSPLSELTNGSRVAVARRTPVFGRKKLPEWEAALLGLFISEGQCHTPDHSPVFTTVDPVLAEVFERYCVEGLNTVVTYNGHHGYRAVNHKGRGGIPKKNRASVWLQDYGLDVLAYDKFVPQKVFMSDRKTTAIFLRALFSGDGSIYKMSGHAFCVEYSSTARRLIEDVHHLLLRFGIVGKIWEKHPRGGRTTWALTVHNSRQIMRFAEEIGFWPTSIKQNCLESFMDEIQSLKLQRSKGDYIPTEMWGYIDSILMGRSLSSIGVHRHGVSSKLTYKQAEAIYDVTGDLHLKAVMSQDILWDTIQTIEYIGEDDVYDLTVPAAQNFLANTIVVHNSTYARCGIVTNFTPLEAGWEGHITIEISNTTPLPARIYANEGIAQILFFASDDVCRVSYADRAAGHGGKYQGQTGITLPKL